MDEQNSWRGHSFTLLIFAGIVSLCSIFFVLGMIVGRAQGQKIATVAAAEADAKRAAASVEAEEDNPELTFYRSVEEASPPPVTLDPEPEPEPEASNPKPPAKPSNDSVQTVINFQISALRRAADAQKLLGEVKSKGFKAFILAPAPGDANPLYRVQVGPYSDSGEAELDRQRLVELKYQPITK